MIEPIKLFSVEDAETIRDALYLARIMIHDKKIIKDPFKGVLSKSRIDNVLISITAKERTHKNCECESMCLPGVAGYNLDNEGHHPNCKKYKGS